jgi:STIP1 family protein 1
MCCCLLQAHYLLGVAQRELGGQLSEAISHLSKALEQAREKGDSIKDEIWRELARAKYQQWQQDSQSRTATAAALKQQLQSMLQAQRLQGEVAGAAAAGCGQSGDFKSSPEQQQQAAMQQWEELLQRAAHLDSRTEVPAAFTCPLTMEVSVACFGGCHVLCALENIKGPCHSRFHVGCWSCVLPSCVM